MTWRLFGRASDAARAQIRPMRDPESPLLDDVAPTFDLMAEDTDTGRVRVIEYGIVGVRSAAGSLEWQERMHAGRPVRLWLKRVH